MSAKVATVAAVAAASLGGATAAAYAGALPAPVQKLAHHIIGAPAATPSGKPTPVGPNPTGAAAFGLCNAYQHALKHGTAAQKSVAFRNLVRTAGGADQVKALCAKVAHPGKPTSRPSAHPTPSHPGKPTSRPHPTPSHPGKPTSHP